jgi:hypothetical protein
MKYIRLITISILMPAAFGLTPAKAGPDEVKLVAETIATYGDRMCGEFVLSGKNEKFEISGEAKAELNNLLKKLADLGLSGTGKFETSSYENVLQSELGNRLNAISECKSKISADMGPLLIQAMNLHSDAGASINNNGNNNVNIIGDNNNAGK